MAGPGEIDYTPLGRNLKRARIAAGLTQEAVAEVVGVSPVFVQKLEAGDKAPSIGVLLTLCKALSSTPNDLLQGVASRLLTKVPPKKRKPRSL